MSEVKKVLVEATLIKPCRYEGKALKAGNKVRVTSERKAIMKEQGLIA